MWGDGEAEEASNSGSEGEGDSDQDDSDAEGEDEEDESSTKEADKGGAGEEEEKEEKRPRIRTKKKSALRSEALEYTEKLSRRGVVYISRVPPFMKPNKARILFEEYGEVTRIYLAEEDASYSKKRKASGGNGSKQFTEGWVEYADKKLAKRVAESLNGSPIGGKKGDFYYDDLWNLKYLKNFQWDYLTEKFAYERRVREQKLKASMLQAKRGNAEFVELIEKNKASAHAQARKKKQRGENGEGQDSHGNSNSISNSDGKVDGKSKRLFRQVQSIAAHHGEQDALMSKNVLGKVFKKK